MLTNEAGRYVFSQVPPGRYNVTFTRQGFAVYRVDTQSVSVGAVLAIDARLRVGSTAATVEVTASTGAELQTMNATVGNTLDNKTLTLLPNIGRDVTSLAVLQPGVTPGGYTAGSIQDQNTYTLDGGNITDPARPPSGRSQVRRTRRATWSLGCGYTFKRYTLKR